MRISRIEGDSGYNTWQDLSRAVVTLDGEIVRDCYTADETLGMVLTAVRTEFDTLQWDDDGNLIMEKRYGRVNITFVE
jgi:hypothetical protein